MTPQQFREARKALGYNIVELATLLERDEKTIRRWETGVVPLPAIAVLAIRTIKPKTGGKT